MIEMFSSSHTSLVFTDNETHGHGHWLINLSLSLNCLASVGTKLFLDLYSGMQIITLNCSK